MIILEIIDWIVDTWERKTGTGKSSSSSSKKSSPTNKTIDLGDPLGDITKQMTEWWDDFTSQITDMWGGFKDSITDTIGSVTSWWSDLWSKIFGFGSKIGEWFAKNGKYILIGIIVIIIIIVIIYFVGVLG